jgi:uncharacterized protein (DUF1015 family)
MKIKPFLAVVPNISKIEADDAFFDTVKEDYARYFKNGLFSSTENVAIYIYEIVTPLRKHQGIISALDLDDYRENKIKKHEKTLLAKEKLQMSLLLERGAMVKPVLLTYEKSSDLTIKLDELIHGLPVFYEITFQEAQQTHRFWQIAEPSQIIEIQTLFERDIKKCYVADGHHRLSANLHFEEISKEKNLATHFDEVLCAFFSTNEVQIDAFNRALKGIEIQKDTVLEKIQNIALPILPKGDFPTQKGEWACCIDETWYYWRWKNEVIAEFEAKNPVCLDVDILNEKIFSDIFDIEDVRKDKRIVYVEGNENQKKLIKLSQKSISFELFPVDIHDLMRVSDADSIMPPKSTWFEPRMRNGLLVQSIPDDFL